jgi:hypothetical protein
MNQQKLTHWNLDTNTRHFQILLLVVFAFFPAVPGLAQGPNPAPPAEATGGTPQTSSPSGRFAIFGDVGVAVPHGDFSTFTDPGLSVDAGLEYMITPRFSAEGFLGYHRFSNVFIGHTNLYQVSGNAKFYLVDESSRVRPFIQGGVGDYVTDSGTSHFGGNVGGGVLFEVTRKFGVQGRYFYNVFSAGSNFRYSTVMGGARWRF